MAAPLVVPVPAEPMPEAGVVRALWAVLLAGEKFRSEIARHLGIGVSDTAAMAALAQAGPLSPRELATRVGLTPSTVTTLLDRLAAADLAIRRPHPSDRRKTVVMLSDHGRTLLAEVRAWMDAAVADLDVEDLPQTDALLSAVATSLTNQSAALKAGDEDD